MSEGRALSRAGASLTSFQIATSGAISENAIHDSLPGANARPIRMFAKKQERQSRLAAPAETETSHATSTADLFSPMAGIVAFLLSAVS